MLCQQKFQCLEAEPEATVEEDYTDDELDVDELEKRMWRDRMLLKKQKEQNKSKEATGSAKHRQPQEQTRSKNASQPMPSTSFMDQYPSKCFFEKYIVSIFV
ncbi:hypothetical protein QQ045_001071 [Rhodiola kirilowii]